MNNGISKLVANVYLYLTGVISGREFVKRVDSLISSDQLTGLPSECRVELDALHEVMAICVWDIKTYSESPGIYVRESEIKKMVEEFVANWAGRLSQLL